MATGKVIEETMRWNEREGEKENRMKRGSIVNGIDSGVGGGIVRGIVRRNCPGELSGGMSVPR